MHVIIVNEKEVMNLQRAYMGEFGGRKRKGKCDYNLKKFLKKAFVEDFQ